jgi:hypothetical protein
LRPRRSGPRRFDAGRRAVRKLRGRTDRFILFIEDDLRFNRYLRYNLDRWLKDFDASPDNRYIVDAESAFGSQALLFSSATAQHFLNCWDCYDSLHDFRMYHLAAMLGPIYGHSPSLVQHVNVPSTWGGPYARACDFIADWKAGS